MGDDINLDYGMQLIENIIKDINQEQPSPTVEIDEYDQLENFEDSPRQEGKQIISSQNGNNNYVRE